MTITIDEEVYRGLHRMVSPRRRSQFIEDAIRPLVSQEALEEGYRAMAANEEEEAEAREWMEGMVQDFNDEAW